MRHVDLALAAIFAVSAAAPAVAADPTQGRPAQLTQKPDDHGKDKARAARPKTDVDKDKDNTRSNKGGAMRGDARSDQVQDMKKR
jgi:hypothetical protein